MYFFDNTFDLFIFTKIFFQTLKPHKMSYTVSQQINSINENNYDDDITVTDIPNGHFPAVTGNSITEGTTTRAVTVEILPLEQAPGGTMHCNTGLFKKSDDESAVQVKVMQDGKEVATNTQNYN